MLSFLRKLNLTKSCLFVLLISLFQCTFVKGEDSAPVVEQQQGIAPELNQDLPQEMPNVPDMMNMQGMPDLGGMLDGLKSLFDEGMEEQDQELEIKNKMLETLPKEYREVCNQAEERYEYFLKNIDIKNGLHDLCAKITKRLNELADKKGNPEISASVNNACTLIDKLEKALFSGAFSQIPAAMPKTKLTINDLIKQLAARLKPLQQGQNEQALDKGDDTTTAENNTQNGVQQNPFDFLLSPNPDATKGEKENKITVIKFESDDFDTLFENLSKLVPSIKETRDREFISNILDFRNIVFTLKNDDRRELMKRYLDYITPMMENAYSAINDLKQIFIQNLNELKKNIRERILEVEDPRQDKTVIDLKDQVKTFAYWKKELNSDLEYLKKFEDLKSAATSVAAYMLNNEGKDRFFDIVALFYDLAGSFITCYQRDTEDRKKWFTQRNIKIWSFEIGMYGVFSYWMYQSNSAAMAKPQLNSHIFNGTPFVQSKNTNPLQNLSSMLSSFSGMGNEGGMMNMLPMMMSMMGNGKERSMKRALLAMSLMAGFVGRKGISSYAPDMLMGSVDKLKDFFASIIYANAKTFGWQLKKYTWPNKENEFKKQYLNLAYALTDDGCDLINAKINEWFPLFWSRCSRSTMEIVSPALLKGVMRQVMPILMIKFNHKNPLNFIADYQEEAAKLKEINNNPNKPMDYPSDDGKAVVHKYIDGQIITEAQCFGRKYFDMDLDAIRRFEKFKQEAKSGQRDRVGRFEWYCMESFLVSYILSCCGAKIGSFIAKKYNKPLWSVTYKVIDYTIDKTLGVCNKLHIIDDETRESWSEIKDDFEGVFDEVPELIDELLAPNSQIRMMLVGVLVQSGFIVFNANEAKLDPVGYQEKIDLQLVQFILSLLVSKIGILTANDFYELMGIYVSTNQAIKMLKTLQQDLQKNNSDAIENIDTAKLKMLLGRVNKDFENKFDESLNKGVKPAKAFADLCRKSRSEFVRVLTEKLRVSMFSNVMGQTVIGPIIKETVGNCIQDNLTFLDAVHYTKEGCSWAKNKYDGYMHR